MVSTLSDTAKLILDEIKSGIAENKTTLELAEEALIPQGVEIPKPELIFALDGIPLFTKKSLSTLKGKAKAGKTTCTAWVIAQTINKEMNALWIDTEQGAYYASRTQFWVLGIAKKITSPYLRFYDLKIHNPKIRTEIVELLIQTYHPDIVIIDGIRDLVFDINDPEQATVTTGNLMKWADLYDCHILSVIHENKGSDHARGHLGTELINKSETVIKVSQDDRKITICEPEFTRGEPFKPFAFDRDTNGIPVMVDYKPQISSGESNSKKVLPVEIDVKIHHECLVQAFGIEVQLAYTELVLAICAAFEMYGMSMGQVRSKSFISFYVQKGYLSKAEKTSNKTFYVYDKTANL